LEGLLYIGIAQSVFASFLMISKKNRQLSDYILSVWLFLIAVQLSSNFLGLKIERLKYPELLLLRTIPFTYGPFLYVYAKLLISEKPKFNVKSLLHLIPFLVFLIFLISIIKQKFIINKVIESFQGGQFSAIHFSYAIAIIISIIIYVLLTMKLLREHRKNILNHFSIKSEKTNLNWLRTIAICFGLAYFFAIIVRFSNFYFDIKNPIFRPEFFPVVGLTIFAYALSFFGFNQPSIFVNRRYELLQEIKLRRRENAEKIQKKETKYEKSGLKEEDAKTFLLMIEKYMLEKKPYLDGNFTIENMAKDLEIQKYYLTQVINEKLNKNFYTFVNEFRVNEVKKKLLDEKTRNFTLLGIAYDCGFNSKSAFNSIFKKITKETPSQFKKRNTISKN